MSFRRPIRARPKLRTSHRRLIVEPLERREMLSVSLGSDDPAAPAVEMGAEIEPENPIPTIDDPVDKTPPQVSFGLPGVREDGLRFDDGTGSATCHPILLTSDTNPTFWGTAEVGAIVQLFADVDRNGMVDAGDPLLGETVAVRTDESHASASGLWEITSAVDLNDLTIFGKRNGRRDVLVRAKHAAGHQTEPMSDHWDQGLVTSLYVPPTRMPDELDVPPDDPVDEIRPYLSFGLAGVRGDGVRTDGSSGIDTCPLTRYFNRFNNTHPTFWGLAEVGATVQLFADLSGHGALDTDGHLMGEAVAVRTDESDAFGTGYWEITSALDLNDLTIFRQRDGSRDVRVRAIDVAGNVNDLNVEFEIFLDTRTPVSFGLPGVRGDGLRTDGDSGGDTNPPTLDTNDTHPTFWGVAEVGEIVQLFADINGNGQHDAGEPLLGETVAVRNDDIDGSASGIWEITSVLDLNDLYDLSIFKGKRPPKPGLTALLS